jgi:3-deoxy-D-manno-octulosonate 8-phosphate phosphatase (KDO 8-P phosphatase)
MHIRDGLALQIALRQGYRVKVISGGNSPDVMDRLQRLGVTDINMSVLDKRKLVESYLHEHGVEPAQALYMGDDLPDVAPLQAVGLAVCPADAVPEVMAVCQYISPLRGGDACVRDVIEKTLRVQGRWNYDGSLASR